MNFQIFNFSEYKMLNLKIMKKLFLPLLLFIASKGFSQQNDLAKLSESSLDLAARQFILLDKSLEDSLFPRSFENGKLITDKSSWWTSGFFPASLWYLYEFSGDSKLKDLAMKKSKAVEQEKLNVSDHDIGFKIYCPFGNALRITNDSSLVPIIVEAANSLKKRFDPRVGLIRSWGKISDEKDFLVIIDNMMNLELLFVATKLTGDSSYYKIAVAQADNTIKNHFRSDFSSYHVVNYDPATGNVKEKKTAQGMADYSGWSRGQAWGLYGYTVCYRETKNKLYLHHAEKIAGYMLNHPNLPKDAVPLWDMNAPTSALRDASAASIMASALLELSEYSEEVNKKLYREWAERTLITLSQPFYRTKINETGNFLLKHGVGHLPANSEVDVPLSYGDYYYIEALMRWRKQNGIGH
jgi:hypothetical protein